MILTYPHEFLVVTVQLVVLAAQVGQLIGHLGSSYLQRHCQRPLHVLMLFPAAHSGSGGQHDRRQQQQQQA